MGTPGAGVAGASSTCLRSVTGTATGYWPLKHASQKPAPAARQWPLDLFVVLLVVSVVNQLAAVAVSPESVASSRLRPGR